MPRGPRKGSSYPFRAREDERAIGYWRDKSGRELDFVVRRTLGRVDAYECKVNPDNFDPGALKAFRSLYPEGRNFACSPWVDSPFERRYGNLPVALGTPGDLSNEGRPGRRRRAPTRRGGRSGSRS